MSGALSILVIDDEDTLRERVMRMLTFEGFEVRGAADGRAGVELAWEYPPDLVICDLLMPGINGFGVCRVLRDDPRTDWSKADPMLKVHLHSDDMNEACRPFEGLEVDGQLVPEETPTPSLLPAVEDLPGGL